jgi:hypothetical protein
VLYSLFVPWLPTLPLWRNSLLLLHSFHLLALRPWPGPGVSPRSLCVDLSTAAFHIDRRALQSLRYSASVGWDMDQRGKSEAEDWLPGIPAGLEKIIAGLKRPEDRAEAMKLIGAIDLKLIHLEAYRMTVFAECNPAFTGMRIWGPVGKFLIDVSRSQRRVLLADKRIADRRIADEERRLLIDKRIADKRVADEEQALLMSLKYSAEIVTAEAVKSLRKLFARYAVPEDQRSVVLNATSVQLDAPTVLNSGPGVHWMNYPNSAAYQTPSGVAAGDGV